MPDAAAPKSEAQATIRAEGRRVRSPRRLSELKPGERRRAVLRSAVVLAVLWSFLFGVYYAIPAETDGAANAFPRLAVGLLLFAAILAWQNSRIGRVELPELRAAGTLGSA